MTRKNFRGKLGMEAPLGKPASCCLVEEKCKSKCQIPTRGVGEKLPLAQGAYDAPHIVCVTQPVFLSGCWKETRTSGFDVSYPRQPHAVD